MPVKIDMSETISANLDEELAAITRLIAKRENRSQSNVVANALLVCTSLSRPLRDGLVELRTEDADAFNDLNRQMLAYMARGRFENAAKQAAQSAEVSHIPDAASDLEILEEATRMSRAS